MWSLSARSENNSTRAPRVRPAEATASFGGRAPFVSTSRIRRSRSVICSTRVFSTEYVTRRTGEKIESTGMTPMGSRAFLLRSAETYPTPRSTTSSSSRFAPLPSEAMCRSGFKISTPAGGWTSPAVTSAGPLARR